MRDAARKDYTSDKIAENEAYQYAAVRNILYRKGYATEILVNYEPSLQYFSEWWKQLAGESEGKDQKVFTQLQQTSQLTCTHLVNLSKKELVSCLKQLSRVDKPRKNVIIPYFGRRPDGLGYLQRKDVDFVNKKRLTVFFLLTDGDVPNMYVTLPEQDAFTLGLHYLLLQLAIALSGYLNAINPFDQPGVEAYKT